MHFSIQYISMVDNSCGGVMDNLINIIGNNLGKIRKEKGHSLAQIAQLTGVSKSMLAQIEKGKKRLP